jgi:hypothetical protein
MCVCVCIFMSMYVCMYLCKLCMYVCMYVCISIYVCVYVCTYVLSEYTTIIPLKRIDTFDFVMKITCVFFKVGNVFNTIQMQCSFTR